MTMSLRRKQLLYRSWHRGCKETDLLLGNFALDNISNLPEELLDELEILLEQDDWDIYNWLTGALPVPANLDNTIMKMLQTFSGQGSVAL